MTDDTQRFVKEDTHDCRVANVSVRGWLAICLTLTVCALSATGVKVEEPLYSLSIMALGFYFGQKTSSNGAQKT